MQKRIPHPSPRCRVAGIPSRGAVQPAFHRRSDGFGSWAALHEINAAFATFVRERPDALFVGLDVFLNNRRAQLVNLASRYTLPAIFSNRDFAEIGGLMSYGSDIKDAFRQVGVYVGRILKGAKPADLPVVQA